MSIVQIEPSEKSEAIDAWKKGLAVVGKGQREQQRKAEVEKKLKAASEVKSAGK